jgi:hypothetical protein
VYHCAQPAPPPVDSKIAHASQKSEPFRRALTEIWRVAIYGEKKHGANNWQRATPEGMHYYEDAEWRHLQLRRMGEIFDPESGERHLAHKAWCALMLLEMELRGVTSDEWGNAPSPCVDCRTCARREQCDMGGYLSEEDAYGPKGKEP